jgi:hypothetical protein
VHGVRAMLVASVGVLTAAAGTVLAVALNAATGGTVRWFPALEQHPLWWTAGSAVAVAGAGLVVWWIQAWYEHTPAELARDQQAGELDPLDVRAREVGLALQRARDLLGELQAEVTARIAIVESLAGQIKQAEQQAAEASARAGLSEKEAEAIDAFLVSALKTRLAELERSARRREWMLATAVATIIGLIVGIASILISHSAFGF